MSGLGVIVCVDLRKEWGRKDQLTWHNLLIKEVLYYSSLLFPDTSACTKGLNPELVLCTFPVYFLNIQILAAASVNIHIDKSQAVPSLHWVPGVPPASSGQVYLGGARADSSLGTYYSMFSSFFLKATLANNSKYINHRICHQILVMCLLTINILLFLTIDLNFCSWYRKIWVALYSISDFNKSEELILSQCIKPILYLLFKGFAYSI